MQAPARIERRIQLLVFSFVLLFASAAWGKPVRIESSVKSPLVSFAVKRLRRALTSAGYSIGTAGPIIRFELDRGTPQSFSIRRDQNGFTIQGGDERGLMYGILRLAEELRRGEPMNFIPDESRSPFLPVRAFKFNMPFPGTNYIAPSHLVDTEWFWDLNYWRGFLNELAEDRYTAIELWSAEPWDQMVQLKEYPEASDLPQPELERHIQFFRALFRLAKERGIDTYLVTWNIDLAPAFARSHDLPTRNVDSKLVRDYLRDSIRTLLVTYPDLTGLGTTQGEQMGKIPENKRADWIADVYFRGIQESGRHDTPFIFRYWGGTPEATEQAAQSYHEGPVYLDIKYNGEHVYSSPQFHVQNSAWMSQTHVYKLLWHLRNDDLYRFRWGDPAFVRQLFLDMKHSDTIGFTYGSEVDIPGPIRYETAAAQKRQTWRYKWQKMWFALALWGRLGYNPETSDALWRRDFRLHYGNAGPALYQATVAASRIAPLTTSYHWDYMNGDWYVEGSIGSWNTSAEQPRLNYRRYGLYQDIRDYIFNNTIDSHYENIPAYVARVLSRQPTPPGMLTPLDVASHLEQDAQASIAASKIPVPAAKYRAEFRDAQMDDEAYGHLGFYYAEKLRGATDLALFLFSGQKNDQDSAIRHLTSASRQWQELVANTSARYITREIWLFGPFNWKMYSPDVARDIDLARAMQPFTQEEQSWEVSGQSGNSAPWKLVRVTIYQPFSIAGLHSWLAYFNSVLNAPVIQPAEGSNSAAYWRTSISGTRNQGAAVELPSGGAATVTVDGKEAVPISQGEKGIEAFRVGSGEIQIETNPAAVPELNIVARDSGSANIPIAASAATQIHLPAERDSQGMLLIPPGAKLPNTSAGGVRGVERSGWVDFHFRLAASGFYKFRCQMRASGKRNPSIAFAFDNWNGNQKSASGAPSGDWEWIESQKSLALGAGEHTLTIRLRPGDEVRGIQILPD